MSDATFPEFAWAWAERQGQSFPALHDRMASWLDHAWRTGEHQLLLMAFRGSGKSTLVGQFAAWLLAQDPNLRLVVLAADRTLAIKMVRNVKRVIEAHPLTHGLKPAHPDQWAADRFTINRPLELRDPSMLASGIRTNLTGTRAEIVICDDVEVPNTCDTALKRADLRQRLGEIDYLLVPGGLQLYVGTPHNWYSIYADEPRREIGESAPFLADFKRLVLPVLDGAGRSRWPERFPPDKLERQRRHTGAAKFQSQMMLQPVNLLAGRLDPDRLRPYNAELDYREAQGSALLRLQDQTLVSASCWWDPAFGAGGDHSVVAALFTDQAGRYYLHRVLYVSERDATSGITAEDEATRQCRAVARFVDQFHLPAVTLEINGLGRFLPGLLRRELTAARIACAVVEVASRAPKHLRILEAFDAVLAAGALHAHRSVWDTPFVQEMRDWRPDGRFKGHDDGLDAVAGCLASEPVRLPRQPTPARRPEWRPGGVVVGEEV